jgi:hypothetical protein
MRVTYRVARVRGEKLHVYPDVYGRAGDFASAVRAELARAGADPQGRRRRHALPPRPRLLPRRRLLALADLSTLRPPTPKIQLAEIAPVVAPVAEAPRPDSVVAPIAEATDTVAAVQP